MITTAQQHAQRNRGTLFVEQGELLSTEYHPGEQYIQRIRAPKCSAHAEPGTFAHISCDESLPMRRPLSIMRARDDWIEVLYKVVGEGLHLLAEKRPGDSIDVLGPIGKPFTPSPDRPLSLLIGGGVGIPPMIFLAEVLKDSDAQPLAVLGSELPFPFELVPSQVETSWLPEEIVSTMPLLESWGVPARLTSLSDFTGCYRGLVTDVAKLWLDSLDESERKSVEIFTCGPTGMLKAVANLARDYDVPCQAALEEFMACAVGGCAGCTVEVTTPDGAAMKRVCVDGPVFDAYSVVWR